MAIKKIGSATEVISLAEAKTHLRLEDISGSHPDDAYVTLAITAAREWAEEYTGIAIGAQTYELALDAFPDAIQLPSFAQAINSVTYVDTNGDSQTLASNLYSLDNYSNPAWLLPAYNNEWPSTLATANAVKVNFESGFTDGLIPDSNPCPKSIIFAMYLIIGNLYENRQEDVLQGTRMSFNSLPFGVKTLLQPYRINVGV